MKKISKKIVALVTMAMFVLTLVPFAAFADTSDNSSFTVEAVDYDTVRVSFTLDESDLGYNTCVWATDSEGNPVTKSGVSFATGGVVTAYDGWSNAHIAVLGGDGAVTSTLSANQTYTVDLTFANPGTYIIHVGVNDSTHTGSLANLNPVKVKDSDAAVATFTRANDPDRSKSEYGVIVGGKLQDTASVNINTNLLTSFLINDYYGTATDTPLENVVVWAVDSRNDSPTSYLTVNGENVGADYKFTFDEVVNGQNVTVAFSAAGTYTLYAAVGGENNQRLLGSTVVTVTDDTVVDDIDLTATVYGPDAATLIDSEKLTFKNGVAVLDLTQDKYSNFKFIGISRVVLNGVAYDVNDDVVKNQTMSFAAEPTNVVELKNISGYTSNNGQFSAAFTMQDNVNSLITITDPEGDEYVVRVIAIKSVATDIDRTLTGGYVLAGNDATYAPAVYANAATEDVFFTDAVQFAVYDSKSEAVTGDEAVADAIIDIRSRATGSTLEARDLKLAWDEANEVYTLKYVGEGNDGTYVTDLIPGKYEVRVAVGNDNATVIFNAAKFGKAQSLELSLAAEDISATNGEKRTVALTDEVTLGQEVTATAKYVDANGIKVKATVNVGATGRAVVDNKTSATGTLHFTTLADTPANESLLGTVVTVRAWDGDKGLYVEQDLTVVDAYKAFTLEFDKEQGPANDDTKINMTVVDGSGNRAQVKGTMDVMVMDQSNDDAHVIIDNVSTVSNGKGSFTIYSDQDTTVEFRVVVKDSTNDGAYAATLDYTVGAEDPLADRHVVMTIGSTEYFVNNNIIRGDAAPYVDSNWRTMVPIRALAESFDAEVIWDNTDRTVTINYDGGTQIVMTVGEDTYTVNGVEQTMDTEPVISGDRTYVPIRFAAEAMNFSVTPLYDAETGATASVVFQR